VIVAANDDMALGAIEAVKARNLDVQVIGFDALPEALAAVRDGALAGTVEQFPGGQSRKAMQIMVDLLKDQKTPESDLVLLTPIMITKDNLDKAERLGELK
ncbi:MAG: substrate-binding domain-containing protein, partial [Geminicoccaceae bacterium]